MSYSRRDFLRQAALLTTSAYLLPSWARAAAAPPPPRPRARALVQIHLFGGMDSILTTDAKTKKEVIPEIELGYKDEEVLEAGPFRLGPLGTWIAGYRDRVAVVNGIDSSTVAHPTGTMQIQELRRIFPSAHLGMTGTLGLLRSGEYPLDEVRFGSGQAVNGLSERPPNGRSLYINYDVATSDQGMLASLSRLAHDGPRRDAIDRALAADRAAAGDDSNMSIDAGRALLARMRDAVLPEVQPIVAAGESPVPPRIAPALKVGIAQWSSVVRDVVFLLENRLTSSIFVFAPFSDWDTHQLNFPLQRRSMYAFAPSLRALVSRLDAIKTPEGRRLSDDVAIVVSSELGRFPIINEFRGKDHFPEHPVLLMGPGIKPGLYGETDQRMMSQPISLRTGKMTSSPRDTVPTLDDLGATVLDWFGIEDHESLGYFGRPLEFLFG